MDTRAMWDPLQDMRRLQRDVERVFGGLSPAWRWPLTGEYPPIDLTRDDGCGGRRRRPSCGRRAPDRARCRGPSRRAGGSPASSSSMRRARPSPRRRGPPRRTAVAGTARCATARAVGESRGFRSASHRPRQRGQPPDPGVPALASLPRAMIRAHLRRWHPRPHAQRTQSTPRVRASGAALQLDPSHRSSQSVSPTGS